MTRKADFNAEEWSLVLEGPPVAGVIVATAHRGGSFREAISMGKAYQEAQKEQSADLISEIVSSNPAFDRNRYKSPE